jgi:hypothetical protein
VDDSKLISYDPSEISKDAVEVFLIDGFVDSVHLDEIVLKNTHRPEILEIFLTHPNTPDSTRQTAAKILQLPVPVIAKPEEEAVSGEEKESRGRFRVQSLYQRIQHLRVGEKIQLALRGSRDVRSILFRDSSKEVVMTVLENPKITESEIEIIAKQKTTPDDVFRVIAKKREWLKNYTINHALVTNPKTPISIAAGCVSRLRKKDLLMLEKNRNISEAVRAAIKRRIHKIAQS